MQWSMVSAFWLVILIGCTTPNNQKPILGDIVQPLDGWVQYCKRNPKDRDCKHGD